MRTLLLILMIAVATTACQQRGKAPAGSPGASAPGSTPVVQFEAKKLGLDLTVASERDPVVPGTSSFQGGVAALNPLFTNEEVVLLYTLSLTSPGHTPFFTWPEGEGDDRIDEAYFTVRNQGADNRLDGDPRAQVVTYDRDAKRFFIPLTDALSRDLRDIGPADEQILTIRLHYPKRGFAQFTLRFSVVGPLHALQIIRQEQPSASASFLSAQAAVPLRRMTFVNPTQRSVKLWLKPVQESLTMIGRFHYLHASGHGGDPVLQLLNWNSRMQLSQLTVLRGGKGQVLPYRSSTGWLTVPFAPGETLELEWAATSSGCGGTRGNLVGVSAEGGWEMASWLTEATNRAQPAEFQSLPQTLALSTGPISTSARIRTGNWDGFVPGAGTVCR